jgi:hypothetical protein
MVLFTMVAVVETEWFVRYLSRASWHTDIEDFLGFERKHHGDEELCAQVTLFYASLDP